MTVIRSSESRISRGLALALPVLVVVSCLFPLLSLLLGSALSWLALVLVLLAGIGVCGYLLRERGIGRSLVASTVSTAAGSAVFLLVVVGLNALGTSPSESIATIGSLVFTAIPVLLVALAVLALVLTLRALPADRLVVCVAWAIAVAAPFALSVPIGSLSSKAGNAGMDVVGLFILPLDAFFVWAFLALGMRRLPRAKETADS